MMDESPSSPELDRVREAALAAVSARSALDLAIRAAWPACSLRVIGAAAGVSHEQVRRIVQARGLERFSGEVL